MGFIDQNTDARIMSVVHLVQSDREIKSDIQWSPADVRLLLLVKSRHIGNTTVRTSDTDSYTSKYKGNIKLLSL